MDCDVFLKEAGTLFESYSILDSRAIESLPIKMTHNSFLAIMGKYFLNREFDGKVYQASIDLVVILDRTGLFSVPIVWLPNEKRPYRFEHLYNDNTCCLGLTLEVIEIWGEKQSANDFFEKIVDPFLVNFLSCRFYGKCATGERPHGEAGIVDYYKDLIGMTAKECINTLPYLYRKVVRYEYAKGHSPCPCGSNEIIRHCHGKMMNEFLNHIYTNNELKKAFIQDIGRYIEMGEKNGKKGI